MSTDRIIGKIILTGVLKTTAPLLIGGERDGATNLDVLLDANYKPYIPASGFVGAYKHYAEQYESVISSVAFTQLFGGKAPDGTHYQSHLTMSDCVAVSGFEIEERHGVKINEKTGVAQDQALYSYELVTKGVKFAFKAEITLREGFDKVGIENFLSLLQANSNEIRLGAFTSFGFGKWEWDTKDSLKVYKYDFADAKHAQEWFEYRQSLQPDEKLEVALKEPKIQNKSFQIEATFVIKGSLIIGDTKEQTKEVDKRSLTSGTEENFTHVLPGKSIKGALRHRARKILDTYPKATPSDIEVFLDKLMGADLHGDDGKIDKKASKSRLRIEESIIENVVDDQTQPRVKIDRFTGAAVNRALFNSQPLFTTKENKLKICLSITQASDAEKGLLLLLLKDLWTADLAIGGEKNVGRGVLEGKSATITLESETITFSDPKDLEASDIKTLEYLVTKLKDKKWEEL